MKAGEVISKNFRVVEKVSLCKVKQRTLKLREDLGLDRLRSAVAKEKGIHLDVFFTLKSHKESMPFRAIVSQRVSWQAHVADFLGRNLTSLCPRDPFRVDNSLSVVKFTREESPQMCDAVSFVPTRNFW